MKRRAAALILKNNLIAYFKYFKVQKILNCPLVQTDFKMYRKLYRAKTKNALVLQSVKDQFNIKFWSLMRDGQWFANIHKQVSPSKKRMSVSKMYNEQKRK